MDSPQRDNSSPVPAPSHALPDAVREAFPGFALPEAALHSIPLPEEFREILSQAVMENRVKTILPKFFNPVFRRQGVVNKLALSALESVGHSLERLAGEIESRDEVLDRLVQHVNAQNAHTHRQQVALSKFSTEIGHVLSKLSETIKREEDRSRNAEVRLLQHLEAFETRKRRRDSATLSSLRVIDRQLTNLRATIDGTGEVIRQRIQHQDTLFEEKIVATQEACRSADAKIQHEITALVASTRAIDTRLAEAMGSMGGLLEALQGEIQRTRSDSEAGDVLVRQDAERLEIELRGLRSHVAARDDENRAEIDQLRARLDQTERHSAELQTKCEKLADLLEDLTRSTSDDTECTRRGFERATSDSRILVDAATAAARAVDKRIDAASSRIDTFQADLTALAELHRDLNRRIDGLATFQGSAASEQVPLLQALQQKLNAIAEGGSRLPVRAAREAIATSRQLETVLDDAFYVALENRFRGPRDAIRERLAHYLPEIDAARARIDGLPQEPTSGDIPHSIFSEETFNVLDLGCGRGEWLRLLGESSIPAIGIDTNKHFLAECTKAGNQAALYDIFEYLRSLPDACVGAVTCFHVIEHIPVGKIRELFHQVFRVLRRGGVAIFETPHAGNLITAALNFHLDPTHHKPVHHLLARFIADSAGFSPVRTEFLHPNEEGLRSLEAADPAVRQIGNFLFGPQDFGLIAVKP